ncbi:hypothetical protein Btru_057293 [Bulinus truncatus]|nr:hypothetical protein Btru_057293 [Bulinus truncatus]
MIQTYHRTELERFNNGRDESNSTSTSSTTSSTTSTTSTTSSTASSSPVTSPTLTTTHVPYYRFMTNLPDGSYYEPYLQIDMAAGYRLIWAAGYAD